MENYLNITQLARLRETTTETLRHYDRIGLLRPGYVDPDTGYRYYSYDQIELFDTIIDLRNMGLPLNEIKDFLPRRNVERSYEILSKKARELEQEIAEKQKLLLRIQQKTAYIDMVKKKEHMVPEDWSITKTDKRIMVISRAEEKDFHDFVYEFTKLRSNMEKNYNVFGSNISGSLIAADSFMDPHVKRLVRYPALPYGICEEKPVYGELVELPQADCLVIYGKGTLVAGDPAIRRVQKYLKQNHYEITGYIYERDIVDISLTNDPEEVIYKLEIPVKNIEKMLETH